MIVASDIATISIEIMIKINKAGRMNAHAGARAAQDPSPTAAGSFGWASGVIHNSQGRPRQRWIASLPIQHTCSSPHVTSTAVQHLLASTGRARWAGAAAAVTALRAYQQDITSPNYGYETSADEQLEETEESDQLRALTNSEDEEDIESEGLSSRDRKRLRKLRDTLETKHDVSLSADSTAPSVPEIGVFYRGICPACGGGSSGEKSMTIVFHEDYESCYMSCFRATCDHKQMVYTNASPKQAAMARQQAKEEARMQKQRLTAGSAGLDKSLQPLNQGKWIHRVCVYACNTVGWTWFCG